MDDLDFLKNHVPQFEGYQDEDARHHSDQRVRALAGSALAEAQERLTSQLDPELSAALSAAILRCQFPDQTFTTKLDGALVDDALENRLAAGDRALVEIAQRAANVDAAGLRSLIDDFNAAFDRRVHPLTAA